mmetsp:Transcript_11376/g.24262  ORF Transcript_11376/g.24262 Transcript_11376/m.24262 type:complete len:104 (-) Transcript_11376:553-864(-)
MVLKFRIEIENSERMKGDVFFFNDSLTTATSIVLILKKKDDKGRTEQEQEKDWNWLLSTILLMEVSYDAPHYRTHDRTDFGITGRVDISTIRLERPRKILLAF